MVDSVQAETGRAALLEQDPILTPKIEIPRIRREYLNRSRLTDALEAATSRKLTLVCTPAGFGKTTLLADWAEDSDLAVAWLSLDPDDNDPTRFCRYLLAALDRVIELDESALSLLIESGGASGEALAAAFIHELEDLPEHVVVVLDDYHVIDNQEVHDGLSFALEHQPSRLSFIVSSRVDPPLPVARLRANNQLSEVRASDLRFTEDESTSFLKELWGLDVSDRSMSALHERTEGWAVGLQLAALSLRNHPDRDAFIEAFTGTNRYVLDYLTEEVFESQPEDVKDFLLGTSILQRLHGPLCDAVTGRSDGQTMLEELDRANLFVVPLDEDRSWYRFHHLFADLLRARLLQAKPDLLPELQRRAGRWCSEHGLVDEAIRHALATDQVWAADLVERHVEELLLRRSERATLVRWLAALPQDIVAGRTRLILAEAIAAQIEGRLGDSKKLLSQAEQVPIDSDEPHDPSVGRAASVLANPAACTAIIRAELARLEGEPEAAASHAESAISHLTPADELLATFAQYHLAVAHWMLGELDPAADGLSRVVDEREAAGERYLAVRACYDLGSVLRASGGLGLALETYRRAERIMAPARGGLRPETGLALAGVAEVLRERGNLIDARSTVTEAIRLCRQLVYAPPLAAGLVTLAWIHQATGDSDRAWEVMEEAQHVVPGPNVTPLLDPARTARIHLALAHGRVEEASRWCEGMGVADTSDLSYVSEPEHLALARLLLATGSSDRSLLLCERLDTLATTESRYGSLIRIRALKSVLLEATGDRDGALVVLAETLSLARPEGYLRAFLDEGPAMATLLHGLASARGGSAPSMSRATRAHLNRVLLSHESAESTNHRRDTDQIPLASPLTDREFEILLLIADGKRNREIASELWVSLDTVKKHVSHILTKLAVTNRTEAVAEARQLELL